jgi:hypothetical protein
MAPKPYYLKISQPIPRLSTARRIPWIKPLCDSPPPIPKSSTAADVRTSHDETSVATYNGGLLTLETSLMQDLSKKVPGTYRSHSPSKRLLAEALAVLDLSPDDSYSLHCLLMNHDFIELTSSSPSPLLPFIDHPDTAPVALIVRRLPPPFTSPFVSAMSDYQTVDVCIATGGQATISRARHKSNGLYFAVKTITTGTELDYNREIQTSMAVSHPSILPIVKFTPFSVGRQIVTPFMESGSLEAVLTNVRDNRPPSWWNLTSQVIVLLGIAAGIEALHDRRLVHRDVKPLNVLLDGNHEPRLIDFGISDFLPEGDLIEEGDLPFRGTVGYCPPEVIEKEAFGPPADIFAFGLLIFAVLTGNHAFDGKFRVAIANRITEGERPRFPPAAPDALVRLAQCCWRANPKLRPSALVVFDELAEFGADGSVPELCLATYREFVGRMAVWRELREARKRAQALAQMKAAMDARDRELKEQAALIKELRAQLEE